MGKQQLVEIAKALTKNVSLLILDEPTAALNDDDSEHLLSLIRGLRDEGVTSIIISHKLGEIAAVADATTIIRDGSPSRPSIWASPPTRSAPSSPASSRAWSGATSTTSTRSATPRSARRSSGSRTGMSATPPSTAASVVDGASLNVRAGEVVGIAGLMGAGRTELAMSVFGRSYGARHLRHRLHARQRRCGCTRSPTPIDAGIAYVSEDRKQYGLNLIQDIRTNVTAAGLKKITTGGWINGNGGDRGRRALPLLAEHQDADGRWRPSASLSGGNQQKVVLSKWLYTEPELLILDEPTRGVDVGAKFEIYSIINELAESGKAIIVISSELPEVMGLSDRIYTLSTGRITGEVAAQDATQEHLMELMTRERE